MGFRTAWEFLTIIPLAGNRAVKAEELARSMAYFPFVGLILGGIIALSNIMLLKILPASVVDALLIAVLIILTRGLHIDGFVDTIDGLAGGKTKEDILHIMRDHRVGALGVVGVVMLIMVKYLSLNSAPTASKNFILIAMPMMSRWLQVPFTNLLPYARQDGMGKAFTEGVRGRESGIATIFTTVVLIFLFKFNAILIMGLMGIVTYLIGLYFKKILGGITGDVIGAVSEVNEVMFLLIVIGSITL